MSITRERAVRHQLLFREVNERIRELGEAENRNRTDFLCECSNSECETTLSLSVGQYEGVRAKPTTFAVAAGHDLPGVERVVERKGHFIVVEKLEDTELVRESDSRY